MSVGSLSLNVILTAVDRAVHPLQSLQRASRATAEAVKAAKNELKALNQTQGKLDAFRQLNREASSTQNALRAAQDRVRSLSQAMRQAGAPTAAMTREFQAAVRAAHGLKQQEQDLERRIAGTRAELRAAGINTRNLTQAQRELRERTAAATAALEQEQARLRAVNDQLRRMHEARARYDRTTAIAGKLAGGGAKLMAGGAITGAALTVPIVAFAAAEDSATQLRAAMMRAGGTVRAEFTAINALAETLGNRLPGTTSDFQDMMTMLVRQGMSAQTILGGLGEAAAYLGVQLKMPAAEAAQFAAKMQDATSTTEKDMMSLLDTVQKAFYLGVDPTNMLAGFAKLTPAMDTIRMKGIEGAKALAPFLVMMDQAGMAGEASGNAIRKVFQAALNPTGKVSKANKGLASEGIQLDFTNTKGEFGGLEKLFAELAKMKTLTMQDRLGAIKEIFGDDAETLQVVSILIEKGSQGYAEVQAKMAAQASLQERVNVQLGTLKNLWDAASGTFTNALVAFGEAIAPELKVITQWIGDLSGKLGAWAKENPQLANAIMKTVGIAAVLMTVLGGLALTAAMALGPFALLRLGITTLGITLPNIIHAFTTMGGVLPKIGQGLLWIGRLAMAHPLIAAAAAIGAAAIYIWQNWETIGPKVAAAWSGLLALWTGLKEKFFTIGAAIVTGLADGIASAWNAVVEKVTSAFRAMVDRVKSFLGIASPSQIFAGIGGDLITGLVQGLMDKIRTLLPTIGLQILEKLKGGLAGGAGKLLSLLTGGGAAAPASAEEGPGLGEQLTGAAEQARSLFSQVTDLLSGGGSWSDLGEQVIGAVGPFQELYGTLSELLAPVWAMATAAIPALTTAFTVLKGVILAHPILAIITVIAAGALLIWQNWDRLGPWFADLWNRLKDTAGAGWDWIRNAAINAGTAILTWFTQWDLLGTIKRAWDDVSTYLAALPDTFVRLGGEIIKGIWRGIQAEWNTLVEKVYGLVDLLPQAVKDLLGIHSPSQVFMRIGAEIPRGLAAGIDAERSLPLANVLDLTERLAARRLDARAPLTPRPIGGGGGAVINIGPIHVHAAPGMDEAALARLVRREITTTAHSLTVHQRSRLTDID